MRAFAGAPPPLPARIGRFEPLAVLGVGGMATIFLARSPSSHGLQRLVALKLMHPHLRLEASWTQQFVEEAKIAAGIVHANVVAVHEVAEDPQGFYLVMDYVEGDSLSGLFKEAAERGERLPIGIAMRILVDALAGLHVAHELCGSDGHPLALVHRDFSPQNVLVGTDGITRLTDFGIAKTTVGDRTRTGLVKGKLAYMSPEQAMALPVDRRTDVWAAGIIAWELVTGRRLYPAEQDEMALLVRLTTATPPRVRKHRPDVPEAVDAAIAAALEPKPENRVPRADAFRKLLLETGLVADSGEVAEYVESAAGPRVARLRAITAAPVGGSPPSDSAIARNESATATAISTQMIVSGARIRSKRFAAYAAAAGLCVAGLGVAQAEWGRGSTGVNAYAVPSAAAEPPSAASNLAQAPAAATGPVAAQPATTVASSASAPSTEASLARPTSGSPATPAARSAPLRPTHKPTVSATVAPPPRKPLLADPLNGP
jgi:serine/threonine-protein kinase